MTDTLQAPSGLTKDDLRGHLHNVVKAFLQYLSVGGEGEALRHAVASDGWIREHMKVMRVVHRGKNLDPRKYGLAILPWVNTGDTVCNLLLLLPGQVLAVHSHTLKSENVIGLSGNHSSISYGDPGDWPGTGELCPPLKHRQTIGSGKSVYLAPATPYWIRGIRSPWVGLEWSVCCTDSSPRRPENVTVLPLYQNGGPDFAFLG